MLKLRINPLVAADLKEICDYIAEDNAEYAAKTIKEIYSKFENIHRNRKDCHWHHRSFYIVCLNRYFLNKAI